MILPPRLSTLYSVRSRLLFENNWIVLKGLKLAVLIPSLITRVFMDVLKTSPYLPLKFLNRMNFDKMIRKHNKSIPAIHRTVFSVIIVKTKDTDYDLLKLTGSVLIKKNIDRRM